MIFGLIYLDIDINGEVVRPQVPLSATTDVRSAMSVVVNQVYVDVLCLYISRCPDVLKSFMSRLASLGIRSQKSI